MQTMLEFCQENGVTSISKVRQNTNKLKYCTFIINGTATNIYFSKRSGEKVNVDDPASTIVDMFVTHVEYDDNREARYKISIGGDDFTSVDDLFKKKV